MEQSIKLLEARIEELRWSITRTKSRIQTLEELIAKLKRRNK